MLKKKRNKSGARLDTLIGQNTFLEGNIVFEGGLRIDGAIKGNITALNDTDAVLTVSEQGKIEGDINVPNMIINGAVTGDVHSSGHVELAAKTNIQGNVYYTLLQMEEGAQINGSLIHKATATPDSAPVKPKPKAPAKAPAKEADQKA